MAGTVSVSTQIAGNIGRVTAACTGDASDGSFPATNLPSIRGELVSIRTKPGSTQPTANYDITLVDTLGLDRLQSVGLNRSASAAEEAAIVYSSTSVHPVVMDEDLSLTIANNSVASAGVTIIIDYELD